MKRLTVRDKNGKAHMTCNYPCADYGNCNIDDCQGFKAIQELAKYEDTRLISEEIQELKERNTAKKIAKRKFVRNLDGRLVYIMGNCPSCGWIDIKSCATDFCPCCGQPLKWEDE